MAWLRLDDGFTKHPKFEGWSVAQKWAFLELMEYCARYRTRGRVPTDPALLPRSITPGLLARATVAGWLDQGADGALWIHDWAAYNPKDPTKAERQQRWRNRQTVDDDVDAHVDGDVDDRNVHSRVGARPRPRPVPSPGSSTVAGKTPDGDQEARLLELLAQTDWTPNQLTRAGHEPGLAIAWLEAALTRPDLRSPDGWAWQGLTTGQPPTSRTDSTTPTYIDPSKTCPDCGATTGEGHHEHCPQLAGHPAEDAA